jgi:hypothetical protein
MSRERTRGRDGGRSSVRGPRGLATSSADRGQTAQDFAVGIGVFLLALAFVFTFLPTVMTPFDSQVSGAETAQADRIADRIVHDLETETANEISGSGFYTDENLTEEVGLRSNDDVVYDRVNVRVETLGGTVVDSTQLAGGVTYDNQSAASAARIVTVEGWESDCDPACRLVVRVW